MKRFLLIALSLLVLILTLSACNSTDTPPVDSPETQAQSETKPNSVKTEAPATEAAPKETEKNNEKPWPEDTSKFTFFQKFDAPTGTPREIVMDYMMKMATVEWTPAEDFAIGWEGPASFDPNMSIKFFSDKTYRGTTYGNTHCSFDLFSQFVNEKGILKMDNYSYEKIIGNNCSTTMTLAYQQIVDMPISVLKPISTRLGLLKLSGDLKIPEGFGDSWYSNEVFAANGQEKVYDAYATLESGDILYKSIKGTGHTRMVRKVELGKSAAGKVLPGRSYVYCVESTNAWEDSQQLSTWFIDRKYSFTELYDGAFMPVTLVIFHEENPTYNDAYLAFDGKINADNLKKGLLPGTVSSNFPLNYVMATIKDADGNVVLREVKAAMTTNYTYDMRKFYIKTSELEKGNYTFTLRAGIARGGADICTFDFTVE